MVKLAAGSTPASRDHGRQERIVLAAVAVFAERTYAGARIPDVAGRAGVAVGTIYRYFPTKQDLGNAAFRWVKTQLRDVLFEGLPTRASVRDQFGWLWRQLGTFARDQPQAFGFVELQSHDAYLDAGSRELDDQVTGEIVAWVKAGQIAGEVRYAEPGLLIALVIGAMGGLVKQARGPGRRVSAEVVRTSEDWAWELLRAPARKGIQ